MMSSLVQSACLQISLSLLANANSSKALLSCQTALSWRLTTGKAVTVLGTLRTLHHCGTEKCGQPEGCIIATRCTHMPIPSHYLTPINQTSNTPCAIHPRLHLCCIQTVTDTTSLVTDTTSLPELGTEYPRPMLQQTTQQRLAASSHCITCH